MNNNYPRKITMDFRETECFECKSRGFVLRDCYYCGGTGTIPRIVTFGLWETCPECKGEGVIPDCYNCAKIRSSGGVTSVCSIGGALPKDKICDKWKRTNGFISDHNKCPKCHGTGETSKYYTPSEAAQMIKEQTGVELKEEDWPRAVDVWLNKNGEWNRATISNGSIYTYQCLLRLTPFQPAPSPDYRPKEVK